MTTATRWLVLLILPVWLAGGVVEAKSLAVTADGQFDEWGKRRPRVVDPTGDGAEGGLDLERLWLADDGEALFLRLEVGRETLLQNAPTGAIGNLLRLYIDLDKKRKTGLPVGSLGVDLEIRFGERQVIRYDEAGLASVEVPGAGPIQTLPTYSADAFEIRVQLPVVEESARRRAPKRRKLRLLLEEEGNGGDRLPDSGVLVYKLGKKPPAPPEPIALERPEGDSLRIVSINVEDARVGVVPEVYTRFLQAIQPDVVCFQELREWSAARTVEFVEEILPLSGGRSWTASQVDDIHTVSSFPMTVSAAVDANQVSRIELPNRLGGGELVLFNIHPPCCDNDAGRDDEVDHLMETWRELLEGTGPFSIDPQAPMVLLGDMNLVGYQRQYLTLREGTFNDPSRGPDFAPGRDEGALREAPLRHTHRRLVHTWRRDTSDFAPGKLDYVFYTGDALELVRSFVPDTEGMPEDALDAAGLQSSDTLEMSDHLPLVVDFVPR